MTRFLAPLALLALLGGCLAHDALESAEPARAAAGQTVHAMPDTTTPTAVARCSGTATGASGERCVETFESAGTVSCQYTVRRDAKTTTGNSSEIDSVVLRLLPDGGFVLINEGVSEENRVARGRKIFTTSQITIEYRETADGTGTCHHPDGTSNSCERESSLLDIGDDPCTAQYLGPIKIARL